VVHACWHDEHIQLARGATNVVRLYHEHADRIEEECTRDEVIDATERALRHQNGNPVKLLTSGPEERSPEPIVKAGGKICFERRVHWWHDYRGAFCVFGHYSLPSTVTRDSPSAFCADYGVGKRWTERITGKTRDFQWRLAALRFPERELVLDEGHIERLPESNAP
jgi:hypothetical protein